MSDDRPIGETYQNKEEGSFGIINFRDLGVSSADNREHRQYIKEGIMFRSATLDNMSTDEVAAFLGKYKVNTIIDLRTGDECKGGYPIDKYFPSFSLDTINPTKETPKPVQVAPSGTMIERKKYKINFAGYSFQRYCILPACSFTLKLYLVYLMIFCQKKEATKVVGREILGPMGVKQMYKEFITHCHRELKQALMIFVNPDNYPIHIHCTQGKDRTGLLSALILLIAGVPEDVIVNDYAKTQREFAPIYDAVVEDVRKAGLTEDFAQAPPQNMRETLEYINTEYGSAIGFMDAIGFDEDLRERVRNIICS